MKNLFVIIFVYCLTVYAANAQIVCNEFSLITKITGSTLELSVNTDLPDNTVVMVSVSRSYWEKGNSAAYSVDYFSESSTIGKWGLKHEISIDNKKWKAALKAKQERLSKIGLGFDVASVSDEINVNMVVPINQPDPEFGERNSNLVGKAVTIKGIRIVEDEIKINYPLDSPPVGKSPFSNLNPQELAVGQSYVISKQTPLMPSLDPVDPMAAIQQMKQIPKGGGFKILKTAKKGNYPWYNVNAFNEAKQRIGTGWINGIALLGQELKVYNEDTYAKSQKQAETRDAGRKDEKVSYEIINTEVYLNYKRSLDVRLSTKVPLDQLRSIAMELKKKDPKKYERTFICYYLPGMKVGEGAWATTHFNPELQVKILGLTAEQEETLKHLPIDPLREVIGSWLDESPFIGSRVTIFRQKEKIFIENTYKDGSSDEKEIIEKPSDQGRKFQKKEGSDFGEFYLIDKQGNLQMWDEEGIISTAKKIDG